MSRSKWKSPYMDPNIFIKTETIKKTIHNTLTVSRNSKVIPKFVGLTINVHNGKRHTNLTVTESMLGHKFGEFSSTRANFTFKKKTKKK